MKYREQLFLRTISDLEAKAASADWYELIRASLLLRQLLLDGAASLVHQVNRDYRLELEFTFRQIPRTGQDDLLVGWVRLPKGDNPNDQSKTTTAGLNAFLAAGCLGVGGRVLTVRDVILTNAHVKGGVHTGRLRADSSGRLHADDVGKAAVLAVDQILNVGGAEASLSALRDIVQVTLEGLNPLADAVRKSARPERSAS